MASSDDPEVEEDLPLPLIVFSCGICQATIPEVYPTKESNQGFHSGSGDEDGIVTKLWIAECSHITCGKHLPGGAAPFHPKDEQPRAPCPQCQEKGDDSEKDLYGIRGLSAGDIDTVIPQEWMSCPAIQLDGAVAGMEAVRFQYMNIARYAQHVSKYWKHAERHQRAMESAYSKERKQRRQLHQDFINLKARVADLGKVEAKLEKWEKRKPLINHYLSVVHEMAKEIGTMRTHMSNLGYDVPKRSYAFEPNAAVQSENAINAQEQGVKPTHDESFGSSSTAVAPEQDHSSSLRKRKLVEYVPHHNDYPPIAEEPKPRGGSRDLMPPPLPKYKPVQRIERPGAAYADSYSARSAQPPRDSVQVYEDGTWKPAGTEEYLYAQHDQSVGLPPSSQQHTLPFRPSPSSHTPVTNTFHEQQWMQRHGDERTHRLSSSQPFVRGERATPALHRNGIDHSSDPAQGPFSRQYARRDDGPQTSYYDADYGTVSQHPNSQIRQPLQPFSASQLNRQPVIPTREPGHGASSPQRATQPPAASVISPFFRRGAASRAETQRPPTRGSFMEPQGYRAQGRDVLNSRGVAPSQPGTSRGYSQRPTLNGLSFIERPYGDNHQPLSPSPTYQDRRATGYIHGSTEPQTPRNSQGLFQRPDRPPPSAMYAPSRPQSTAHRGRITFQPSQQSAVPLGQSQEHTLSQIRGVRGVSSYGVHQGEYQNGPSYDASRNLFSSAGGRRSVRR